VPEQDAAVPAPPHDAVRGEVVDHNVPTSPPRKTFSSFVIEQRNGALHSEASDELATLVKAVQDHNKAGSIQITIHVKPGSKGTNTLVVSDEVKVKAPQGDRPATLFFPDEHGDLHRSDPRQQNLPLRRVEVGPAAPLRRPGGDA
jgi:hypothetical protein